MADLKRDRDAFTGGGEKELKSILPEMKYRIIDNDALVDFMRVLRSDSPNANNILTMSPFGKSLPGTMNISKVSQSTKTINRNERDHQSKQSHSNRITSISVLTNNIRSLRKKT